MIYSSHYQHVNINSSELRIHSADFYLWVLANRGYTTGNLFSLCAYLDTVCGNVFSNPMSIISCTAIAILMYDHLHTNCGICRFF